MSSDLPMIKSETHTNCMYLFDKFEKCMINANCDVFYCHQLYLYFKYCNIGEYKINKTFKKGWVSVYV